MRQYSFVKVITITFAFWPDVIDGFTQYSPNPDSCVIIGDTDLYGVGIRLGLYLQWLANFIACLISPEDAISCFFASIGLTLAIYIGFLSGSGGWDDGLVLVEWVIVVHETFSLYALLILPVMCCYGGMEQSRVMWSTVSIVYGTVAFASPYIVARYGSMKPKPGCPNPLSHSPISDAVFFCFFTFLGLLWSAIPLFHDIGIMIKVFIFGKIKRLFFRNREVPSNSFKLFAVVIAVAFGILFITRIEYLTIVKAKVDCSNASLKHASQLIPFLAGLFNLTYICCCGWKSEAKWPIQLWYADVKETAIPTIYAVISKVPAIQNPLNWVRYRNPRYAYAPSNAEQDESKLHLVVPSTSA